MCDTFRTDVPASHCDKIGGAQPAFVAALLVVALRVMNFLSPGFNLCKRNPTDSREKKPSEGYSEKTQCDVQWVKDILHCRTKAIIQR